MENVFNENVIGDDQIESRYSGVNKGTDIVVADDFTITYNPFDE